MKPYPSLRAETVEECYNVLQFITREREIDVRDWNNLQNVFMSGRKVGKIPTGSADIIAADRVGDFNYDSSYYYIVVDNSGTAEWRRIALGVW